MRFLLGLLIFLICVVIVMYLILPALVIMLSIMLGHNPLGPF